MIIHGRRVLDQTSCPLIPAASLALQNPTRSRERAMSSQPRRDPLTDPLLTPENAALILIDYQPPQVNTIRSMDALTLIRNAVSLAQTAKAYGLPTILSTVSVKSGGNPDTVPELREAMSGATWIDRTSINAWEDADFVRAVTATG